MQSQDPLNDDVLKLVIGKHIDYQIGLINRRWQYFATYLLVNGLQFNVWKDIVKSDIVISTLLSVENIIVSCIFLQLMSLACKRIERSQAYLVKANVNVVHAPLHGKIYIGETILLYIALIIISIGWFYLLYLANSIIAIIVAIFFVINLFILRWKTLKVLNGELGPWDT